MTNQKQHLPEKCLANRWSISARTLQRWRWLGLGPPYMKIGGRVRYSIKDIEDFEEQKFRVDPNDAHKPSKKDLLTTNETNYDSRQN
jgi:hypothetical protein